MRAIRAALLVSTSLAGAAMWGVSAFADPVITTYSTSTPVAQLVTALQAANSGITVLSASFIGIDGQSATYTGFNLPSQVATQPTIAAPDGVLLTNGSAALPLTNTATNFSHYTGTGSDAQLNAILGAQTYDQNVLNLTFVVNNPTQNGIRAQFVYGTDEYPEYTGTYNDPFGFFLDGTNYASFPNGNIVSINTNTVQYFNDNNTRYQNGQTAYGLEYDGISNLLTVNALLDQTTLTHTLSIAVGDALDTAVDTGVFIGGLQAANISTGGITTQNTIDTTHGDIQPNVFSLGSPAAQAPQVEFDGGTLRMQGGTFPGNIVPSPVYLSTLNGTVDTTPASGGFSGNVSGPGSLTVIGSNIFSLTGNNSYAGGTNLQGGTLLVGSDTALGTGPLAMSNGTTLREDVGVTLGNAIQLSGTDTIQTSDTTGEGDGLILNGTVSGTGTLVKTGASGLRLVGDNTYSGGTLLLAGHIGIASNTALGTGTLTFAGGFLRAHADGYTVSNAAVLQTDGRIDTQEFGLTYAGAISGPGQLIKTGTGTLSLTAANSYTGGTLIRAGTIAVSNAGALGTGTFTFGTGTSGLAGTLRSAVDGLTLNNQILLSNSGTVDTGANRLTLAGVISGDGALTKLGTGTLAPTNFNSYGGGTTVLGGTIEISTSYYGPQTAATLQAARQQPGTHQNTPDSVTLENQNGDVASSVGYGPVTLNGGAVRFTGSASSLANQFRIGPGGGTIDSGGQNGLTLHGGFADAAGGTGTLTLANTGAGRTPGVDYDFFLFRTSAFTGGTVVAGNTYVMSDSDNAVGTGALQVNAGGTFDLGAFNQAVTRLSGEGAIIASGYGDLNLTGTLTVQSGAFAGTLADGTNTDTFINVTSRGLLGLTKVSDGSTSGGTLLLSGTSSYLGPTAVTAGTLQAGSATAFSPNSATVIATGATLDLAGFSNAVGSLAGSGTVTNSGTTAAALTAGGNNGSTTFAGALTDGGAVLGLTKTGSGTLALTGSNSFTGGTLVQGGTLAVGSSTALGTGGLALDDGTTLLALADGLSLGNAIAFTGRADPTVDTGANTLTLSGDITGPGALTKLGSGTLILTGTDSYTGATDVAAGTLQVDGTITASPITLESGAALDGSGRVASFAALNGAVVAPSSTGGLAVTGNASFASGATYQVTVNPDGSNTRLAVGGSATLGGSRLAVLAGAGTFSARSYTLLTAAGGISGTFGSVSTASSLALLRPTVSYAPTDVVLTLSPVDFATVATTPNQAQVAGAIQALGPGNPLYDAVLQQNQAGARQAFATASGVSFATSTQTARTNTRFTTGLVIDRLWDVSGNGLSAQQVLDSFAPDRTPLLARCYAAAEPLPPPPPKSYTAWGEGFGVFGHTDGTANSGSSDRSLGGFVLGVDTPLQGVLDSWRGGVAVGYTNTTFTSSLDNGRGSVQGVYGSLYGGARYGAVDVRVGTTVGGTFLDSKRTVAFPGFVETEKANNAGATVQTFGEVGYRIPVGSGVIEPVAGAAYLHAHQDAFQEQGGAAALRAAALDTDLGITTLGFRGEVQPLAGVPMVAHVFLGWQHSFGDISPATTLAFEAAPANTFSVTGVPLDRDALAAELALDYRLTPGLDLGASYGGLIGTRAADHAVKGRVEYRF